jgi:predicted nuclease of restriction endonuclease-like RecB superfamily
MMTYESEYFFDRDSCRWLLCHIPHPQDPDPVRYAILASLVEALVASFNWKLELGIRRGRRKRCDQSEARSYNFTREEAPLWAKQVPGLEKQINLINREKEPFAKADEFFLKRNIIATTGYLYTV